MCADFRVKCEVEVRGRGERADSPLSLCRIPKARRISGSSQGDICEKPRATLPRALSCRIPFFRAGAKYHGIHHASRRPTAAPILRVGREGQKSRPRTNKTRGQRGGSETLTYVCYDRNLWELNEKKDASAA